MAMLKYSMLNDDWEGEGDRTFERRLKRYKKASRLCPLCSAGAHNRMKPRT